MKQQITIEVEDFCILPNGDVKIQLPPHQVTVSGNIVLKAEHVIVPCETLKLNAEDSKKFFNALGKIAGEKAYFGMNKIVPLETQKEFDENGKQII
jgi:hypothetical protein